MTKATAGPGFLLQIGDAGSPTENFTTVTEVRDLKGPNVKTDVKDVTNQSSPGGYEEVIPTIRRSGEVTFPVNAIPTDTTHKQLIADCNAKTLRNFRLQNSDTGATKWSFAAYVIGYDQTAPVDGVLEWAIILKLSGPPVLA